MPHSRLVLRHLSTRPGLRKDYSQKPLGSKKTLQDINECVLNAKYAVRGLIPLRAEELKQKLLEEPGSLPFDKIINANIGNPQQLDQKPLTFYRQVLALLQNPDLISDLSSGELHKFFKPDAVERAKKMLKQVGGSVGAVSYTHLDVYKRQL